MLRGGEGTVDWDTVASNRSTGSRVSNFNKRISSKNTTWTIWARWGFPTVSSPFRILFTLFSRTSISREALKTPALLRYSHALIQDFRVPGSQTTFYEPFLSLACMLSPRPKVTSVLTRARTLAAAAASIACSLEISLSLSLYIYIYIQIAIYIPLSLYLYIYIYVHVYIDLSI